MSFPEPYVGLVIRYSYLWKREFDAGREEGTKDRPCAIVMAVVDEDGDKEVLVLLLSRTQRCRPSLPTRLKFQRQPKAAWVSMANDLGS